MGVCQTEKRERRVTPGRGTEVGTCVVYFGSSESWVLEWAGKRLEIRLGRRPRARVGQAVSASLGSVRRAVCGHCSRCPAEFTHPMLMVAHGHFLNMLQVTQ